MGIGRVKGQGMRFLKWCLIVLVMLFTGGWFAAKWAIEGAVTQALADAQAQGKTAEASSASVAGFPTAIDLRIENLHLADPVSGAGWQAPALSISAPTWSPWALTAALPPEQVVTLPDQMLTLQSAGLTLTLTSAPDPAVPLRSAGLAATTLAAQSDQGWALAFGEISVSLTEEPQTPNAYAVTFDLAPLTPDPLLMQALAQVTIPDLPASDLPAQVEQIDGQLRLRLTAPLDRNAAQTRPQLDAIEISAVDLAWGALTLHAEGTVEADDQGFAAGRVMLELRGWDRLPALLVATGTIKPEIAPTIHSFLRAIAAESPDPDVLALPLQMEGGRMSLGPFPLGDAPMLRGPTG
jgi:hypothetical protein